MSGGRGRARRTEAGREVTRRDGRAAPEHPLLGLQRAAGNQAVARLAATRRMVQRDLGVEVEVGGGDEWRVWQDRGWWSEWLAARARAKGIKDAKAAAAKQAGLTPEKYAEMQREKIPRLPQLPKGTPIVPGPGYEVQAEDSGDESTIEFVTKPLRSRAQFDTTVGALVDKAAALAKRNSGDGFTADQVGGSADYRFHPGYNLTGSMQLTAGVPLASIPALYRGLTAIGAEGSGEYEEAAAQGEDIASAFVAEPSAELAGLLTLLRHYLTQGAKDGRRSFPKAIFKVLARTDFKTMFSLVPEAPLIVERMDAWVDAVLAGLPEDDRAVAPAVNYDESGQSPDLRIDTTRGEWLRDMPERDRLTGHDHGPLDVSVHDPERTQDQGEWVKAAVYQPAEDKVAALDEALGALYQGMGGYKGNVDAVQYEGAEHPTPAVIVEIRNPPTLAQPSSWRAGIEKVFTVVDDAIRRPHGEGHAAQPYEGVAREGSGVAAVMTDAAHRVERALLGLEADVASAVTFHRD